MGSFIRLCSIAFVLMVGFFPACTETPETTGQLPTSERCPGEECVACDGDDDCDGDAYCDEIDGESVCVVDLCEEGESECDGDAVIRCDDGAFGDPELCDSGICVDGQCGCDSTADCADGEDCTDGLCVCDSGVHCDGVCCGDDEVCDTQEFCDDDGDCKVVSSCRDECQGSLCGFDGELCCDGDTPVCGPAGGCAPDCADEGDLCGEDYDECCPDGDVCVFGECRTPGQECETFTECDFGEYCDEVLGRCLPDEFPDDLICEEDYDFEEFESEFLWHWDGVEVGGHLHDNVAMTPVVADMNDSGTPDVVVAAYRDTSSSTHMPVVIDGQTGETIYYNDTRWTRRWGQLALADVTDNGRPEIITGNSGGVGVIEDIVTCPQVTDDEDCYLWWNDDVGMSGESQVVADVNADGTAEIVVNDVILDAETGEIIADANNRGYDYTVVADITGDGTMELLSERCLLELDGDQLHELWCNGSLPSGGMIFAAVGDVADDDGRSGQPEFVITGDGNAYVVAADDGEILHQFSVPGGGRGGPPIVADFDGDGSAEFGIAGQGCYTVYDLDCLGDPDEDYEGCQRPDIEPCTQGVDCFGSQMCPELEDTGGTGDGILWSIYIQDISSSRTGSSVFDFQGDGQNEVVYNDECLLMVFDGQTGEHLFRHPNTTRTASEYPIVVDVNGDTRTNFVVAANNDQFSRDCETPMQNRPDRYPECHEDGEQPDWCTEGTTGVFALEDPEDRWVRTRQIWSQFAYHIDNANDDATIPTSPVMPWETHNTFRANRQGEIPLNAADPAIQSVQTNALSCPPEIEFQVFVQNAGVAAIPAGMPVSIYLSGDDQPVVTSTIDEAIAPGASVALELSYEVSDQELNTPLTFTVAVNDDGTEEFVFDCNPDKASQVLDAVECQIEL